MMANGGLVRILIHTDVTKYLNFKAVDGSFVYNKGKVWCLILEQALGLCASSLTKLIEILLPDSQSTR